MQGAISHAIHTAQIGRTLDVFVEGMSTVQARREPVLAGARGTVGLTLNGHALADDDGDCSTGCCTAAPPVEWHESPTVQLSGRTDGDLITVFDVPRERAASLVGQIVPVLIEESRTLTLKGRLAR